MKIMLVHGAYQQRGGEEVVVEQEQALLRRMGHEAELFSFENAWGAAWPKWKQALTLLWNPWIYWQVRQWIKTWQPDAVHIHNLFPFLSPAVVWAAKHSNVPVVATLHNYRLSCANGLYLRNGKHCEECAHKRFPFPAIEFRCYRNSRLHSAGVAISLWVHRLMHTWKQPALLIAPSQFAADRLNASGVIDQPVSVKAHFVAEDSLLPDVSGKQPVLLFVGRFSEEKGLALLLEAWKRMEGVAELHLVGDGPLKAQAQAKAAADPRIILHGVLPPEAVKLLMLKAAFVVVPSLCYETMSRVVMEAFSAATAVIVPSNTAPGSLVEENVTGHHFECGNPEDLARVVSQYISDSAYWQSLGVSAHAEYAERYSAQAGERHLSALYEAVTGTGGE